MTDRYRCSPKNWTDMEMTDQYKYGPETQVELNW